ncbi:MAG: hypothetical protein QOF03_1854, partial [Alphaproteobacteria bacterium]|nr:hypothetical protein [Alphaproteobacteria bacterium]
MPRRSLKSTRKAPELDGERLKNFVSALWDDSVVPSLTDYICIPNKSPAFDKDWAANGHMDAAVALMESWARNKLVAIPAARLDVVRLPGRTPVIVIEIPGEGDEPVLLYGHLDKQPEFTGWAEGLGPWTPVKRGEKLYGRGGADDGYAMYGALSAILALHDQGIAHARCVVLIEACEESGSYDLPYYVDHLSSRIGKPGLVICLDSGCGDYERLWLTTSLRGVATTGLTVRVLTEGVHSGDASGIVPSSFRIARRLLSRLEDEATGEIIPRGFYVDIPPARLAQTKAAAAILGKDVYAKFPFAGGTRPMADDPAELILNRTWRPELAVVGADGLPAPADAGNVLLPSTTLKLSLRLPPTFRGDAVGLMREALTQDVPYGAEVVFDADRFVSTGWEAPAL